MTVSKPLVTYLKRFYVQWLLLPALLLFMIIFIFWAVWSRSSVLQSQEYYVTHAHNYIDSYLRGVENNLLYLETLIEKGGEAGYDSVNISIETSDRVHRLVLLDRKGQVLQVFPSGDELLDFSGLIYSYEEKQRIETERRITSPYYSSYVDTIVVGITRKGPHGTSLLAELNLDELQLYSSHLTDQLEGGRLFITDAHGNLLSYPDMGYVYRQENVGNLPIYTEKPSKQVLHSIYRSEDVWELYSAVYSPEYHLYVLVAQSLWTRLTPIVCSMVLVLLLIIFVGSGSFFFLQKRIQDSIILPLSSFSESIEAVKEGAFSTVEARRFLPSKEVFRELEHLQASFSSMRRIIAEREYALREREKDLSTTLYSIGDAVISTDPLAGIKRMNPEAELLTGWKAAEAVGMEIEKVFLLMGDKSGSLSVNPVRIALEENRVVKLDRTHILEHRAGLRYQIAASASPIHDAEAKIIGAVLVFRDMSEQYKKDEAIRKALRERETMLKEIHHRVKNNLSVVASLLSLQADSEAIDKRARQLLLDSRNRILSMAMVHEDLYQSENFSSVDMHTYIDSFIRSLSQVYHSGNAIQLHIDIHDICLDIAAAIPCGIIINELVTNALKYAFPDSGGGNIYVSLHECGNEYVLEVKDDGIAFPDDLDLDSGEHLGLTLVTILVSQLRGSVKSFGTDKSFLIVFPK